MGSRALDERLTLRGLPDEVSGQISGIASCPHVVVIC